jgi:hypothetical protein
MAIFRDLSGNGVGAEINNPLFMKNFEFSGTGTPEGAITAPVGSRYRRTDGGAATSIYVKESGTGNTGWVGK